MGSVRRHSEAVVRVGSKSALLLQGEAIDSNADLVLPQINFSALDRLIVLTATEDGQRTVNPLGRAAQALLHSFASSRIGRIGIEKNGSELSLSSQGAGRC